MLPPQQAAAHQAAAAQAAKRQAQAELIAKREAARKAAPQAPAQQRSGQQPAAGSAPTASGSPQSIAQAMLGSFGWSASQVSCLEPLWAGESGWSVTASNPSTGAYGIPQAMPASKMASAGPNWQTSAATQIRWGLGYIKSTYGSPCAAWSHEEANGWYSAGRQAERRRPPRNCPGSSVARGPVSGGTATRRVHRLKIRENFRPQPRSLRNKLSLGFNVGLDRGRLSRAGSAVTSWAAAKPGSAVTGVTGQPPGGTGACTGTLKLKLRNWAGTCALLRRTRPGCWSTPWRPTTSRASTTGARSVWTRRT